MAKIEKDFIERDNPTRREFKAEPFIPRKPIPDLGHEKLDGERFYKRIYAKRMGQKHGKSFIERLS